MAHVRDLQFPRDHRGIPSSDSPTAAENHSLFDIPRDEYSDPMCRIFPRNISIRSLRDSRRRVVPLGREHLPNNVNKTEMCVILVSGKVYRDGRGLKLFRRTEKSPL